MNPIRITSTIKIKKRGWGARQDVGAQLSTAGVLAKVVAEPVPG